MAALPAGVGSLPMPKYKDFVATEDEDLNHYNKHEPIEWLRPLNPWIWQGFALGWLTFLLFTEENYLERFTGFWILACFYLATIIMTSILGIVMSVYYLFRWFRITVFSWHITGHVYEFISIGNYLLLFAFFLYKTLRWAFIVLMIIALITRLLTLGLYVYRYYTIYTLIQDAKYVLKKYPKRVFIYERYPNIYPPFKHNVTAWKIVNADTVILYVDFFYMMYMTLLTMYTLIYMCYLFQIA